MLITLSAVPWHLTLKTITFILIGVALMLLLDRQTAHVKSSKRRAHNRKIKNGDRVIAKLKSFEGAFKEAKQLTYLRKINPYVFEEMLLTLFHAQGYTISRNRSYSNDGGFDGQLKTKNNEVILIQAKRYKGYVNGRHIEHFAKLVEERHADAGYFVHTGKTATNLLHVYRSSNISIVSGSKLIKLLEGITAIDKLF